MVEGGFFPAGGCVTRAAVDGESAFMGVVIQMAILAGHHRLQLGIERVAIFAIHVQVFSIEFEGGQVVVECGGNPRVHGVARLTVRAETKFMRLIVAVTGETVARRGLQVCQFARVGVATVTVHLHVRACQGERDLAVIEMFVVGVHAIVAGQAIIAPTQQVRLRKRQIESLMTFDAGGRLETCQAFGVTILANEGLIREGQFVTAEGIIHHIVGEFRPRRFERERGRRAAMLGVTMRAIQVGIVVHHLAVRFGDLRHFRDDLGMAILTTIGHSLRRPGRHVAEFAIAERFRVRGDPADGRAFNCVERARRKHAVAARQDQSHYG